jgi:hypothetical protein
MTSKEKALQLIDLFDEYAESRISENGRGFDKKYCSKQCALIAVGELLILAGFYDKKVWDYLEEVKQEIEKL